MGVRSSAASLTGPALPEPSNRVWTLPNALSGLRLIGVPLFLWAILARRDGLALTILAVSGITDYLDGKIARHYGLVSRLGQLLDPVADRLYIASTLVGLALREIIPWWLVGVLLAREVFMGVLVLLGRRHDVGILPVHFIGKAATFALLYAFPLLLLGDGSSPVAALAQPIGWSFAWWGTALYWIAGVLYAMQLTTLLRAEETG
ncbi:MAG: CDP-alcohol phosphatidyltransferase family protein [Nostocoides sp.]